MGAFDRAIRYAVYTTMAYITAVMGRNWYYNKRLARFGEDIYAPDAANLSPSQQKERARLREYYDAHMGRQILDNLHSSRYLGDKVKERLSELEVRKIRAMSALVSAVNERERGALEAELREVEKEMGELNDFRSRVRKERFYDVLPDEDEDKIS